MWGIVDGLQENGTRSQDFVPNCLSCWYLFQSSLSRLNGAYAKLGVFRETETLHETSIEPGSTY